MGKSIVMHIDEAPWVRGEARKPGGPITGGSQLIGDLKEGPWIHIHSLTPGMIVKPHSHNETEVIYIVEGELTLGDRICGPGTVAYIEKDTEYGFTVGPEGVRFINIRQGLASMTMEGKTSYPHGQ